jgi:CO/xanthine dehydrogenase Mo-binding subunit
MVSEASLQDGRVVVHKVACVVDCGQAVNTDQIIAQLESGVIFGLSAVLFGRIDLAKGRVQQSNFHDYRAVRMSESPEIVCDIIPSDAAPTGVGELGLPLVAPTVAAAIFQATGKRLRDMPFIDALKES